MSERSNAIDESDIKGVAATHAKVRGASQIDTGPQSASVVAAPIIAQASLNSPAASSANTLQFAPAGATASTPVDLAAQQIAHTAMAQGFADMKSGDLSVFDSRLLAHYYEANNSLSHTGANMSAFIAANKDYAGATTQVDGTNYITIDVTAKDGDGAKLLQELQGVGLQLGASYGNIASGLIAADKIGALVDLAQHGDLGHARESAMMTNAGRVTTQADHAEHANDARADYGVDGSGVKVGVISNSFNYGGYDKNGNPDTAQSNIANGDLPQDTSILVTHKTVQDTAGDDEGRGMAQLIHDLAPGSAIEFATANGGQANFANNILGLAKDGAQIIVDDVFYYAEPAFQDGIIAQAVDKAVEKYGVTYFSSAGNQGSEGWEGNFNVAGGAKTIGEANGSLEAVHEQFMDFAPGQDYLELNLQYYDTILLTWDQPSTAAGNAGGATGDLDFYLTNQDGSVIYRSSEAKNIGDAPLELLDVEPEFGMPGLSAGPIYLRVGYYAGDMPEHVKIIDFNNDLSTTEYNQNTGTTFGHSGAADAISVAAARYADTPEYGTDPAQVEAFSSSGPVDIWLDANGNHLAHVETRDHPQITAVDGGNTTFFGSDDNDPDGNPNFYGTSAAAPDAAAIGALMLDANSALDHQDILNLMMASASDMGAAGYDDSTGAGLINADLSVAFASGETISNSDQYILDGTHLDDRIVGSSKDNELNGGDGDDVLRGKTGSDSLMGGQGYDRMFGGSGDDQLASNGDGDYLFGGVGADTYIFTNLKSAVSGTIANLTNADHVDFSLIDVDSKTDGHQGVSRVDHFSGEAGQFHGQLQRQQRPHADQVRHGR